MEFHLFRDFLSPLQRIQPRWPLVTDRAAFKFQISTDGSWVIYIANQDTDGVYELYVFFEMQSTGTTVINTYLNLQNDLKIKFFCVEYEPVQYAFNMEYYVNTYDLVGNYWNMHMDTFTVVETQVMYVYLQTLNLV